MSDTNLLLPPAPGLVQANVRAALTEDVGDGDITASLIAPDALASGRVISREAGILCGSAWVDEVFAQVDRDLSLIHI